MAQENLSEILPRNDGVARVPQSDLRIKKLSEKAVLPSGASPLSPLVMIFREVTVPARGKALVPTDLSIGIPEGTYALIVLDLIWLNVKRQDLGWHWKNLIDVVAGVMDADYRGPVGVILFNHSDVDFQVKHGDRIARFILKKIMAPEILEVEDLDSTLGGTGGFGSTGI
ncbi:hypothetical protein CRYUN_Cryun15aG0133200 [Craigia yunnanensis]